MMISCGLVQKYFHIFLHIKYSTTPYHLFTVSVYIIVLIFYTLLYLSTKWYDGAKLISLLYFQNKKRGKVE